MKRAVFIVVAALLVLLVYPSTHSLAKSPVPIVVDGGVVISPPPSDDTPMAYTDGDDEDDGDADGLSGNRGRGTKPAGVSYTSDGRERVVLTLKMWWNFMFWIR